MIQPNATSAIDALLAIPPDLPRDKWVRAGMAAQAAGLNFDDFNNWSAQAPNYHASDCRDTWRSFKPGKGIGAGTLYAMAAEHGGHSTGKRKPHARPLPAPAKPLNGTSPAEVYERCEPATDRHAYIVAKGAAGVPLDALRVVPDGDPLTIQGESMAGALVVPVTRPDGALSTLQFIAPLDVAERLKAKGKPGKLNLPGGKVDGWFTVGELAHGAVVYIVEGVGAAWSCWQATGFVAVACFGSSNMAKVAKALRQRDETARLVICPDVGKESDADRIAAEVGAAVVRMPDGWPQNKDVNDLAQRDGHDTLQLLLEVATEPPKPPPLLKPVSVSDVLTHPSPPPAFIWDGYLPRGEVALFGAHGGTGKSVVALMLAVCAAFGRPLFGIGTIPCKVVFASLEDGADIVRHRIAGICRSWGIDPVPLEERLRIVDGTEHPELFSAETRGSGETTASYTELCKLVQSEDAGLVLIDNASDAFGGDEIQRRQVRAFMRTLKMMARLTGCSVLLLAHVDKSTSRNRTAVGGEAYSGSTAWHNSARSRLFLTRAEDDTLTLEHQKSNFGKLCEPLTLQWPDGGLPQLVNADSDNAFGAAMQQGRADDERAIALLRLIAEFESRQQYCSPATTSRNHVHAVLRSEPTFHQLKLTTDATKRIVNQCQRAKWLESVEYKDVNRKLRQKWTITPEGRAFARLSAPTAPTAPTSKDGTHSAEGAKEGAPTAPSSIGGVGDRAHTEVGADRSRDD